MYIYILCYYNSIYITAVLTQRGAEVIWSISCISGPANQKLIVIACRHAIGWPFGPGWVLCSWLYRCSIHSLMALLVFKMILVSFGIQFITSWLYWYSINNSIALLVLKMILMSRPNLCIVFVALVQFNS